MAKPKNMRLKWAHKILRAKNFVVMTDKESIIALEGISPSSLNDVLVLQEQTASLRNFMSLMEDLMQEHDKAIEKAMGGQQREKAKTNAPTKRKSVHKKEV